MPMPPKAVAAADAFNKVRREIVILFLPAMSSFAFVMSKTLLFGHHVAAARSSPFG
jgi:hypothetical protein